MAGGSFQICNKRPCKCKECEKPIEIGETIFRVWYKSLTGWARVTRIDETLCESCGKLFLESENR